MSPMDLFFMYCKIGAGTVFFMLILMGISSFIGKWKEASALIDLTIAEADDID